MSVFDFEPEVGEHEFLEAQALYAEMALQNELEVLPQPDEQETRGRLEPFCSEDFRMVEAEAVA